MKRRVRIQEMVQGVLMRNGPLLHRVVQYRREERIQHDANYNRGKDGKYDGTRNDCTLNVSRVSIVLRVNDRQPDDWQSEENGPEDQSHVMRGRGRRSQR